jgi:hypothetical protein
MFMSQNNPNEEIEKKALSVKQLELNLARLQKEHEKSKAKLAKQIEKVKEQEQKSIARKQRNKRIYDWGGLLPATLGVNLFDSLSDNADIKNVMRGLLIKLKQEYEINGFGFANDNKQTWLEHYKQSGKKFIDTQKIDTHKSNLNKNSTVEETK